MAEQNKKDAEDTLKEILDSLDAVSYTHLIDPVTGEQVNLDSLSDQESISMEADWPSSVNEFQWALYKTDGELCVEGTTDISSAQATVTLLLTGDGDLEKVEELFE